MAQRERRDKGMQVETGRGEMENIVQIKGEKMAFQESELDRLVRMATQPDRRKEARVPGDAPLVQIVNYLIDEAIRMRASDIHIEPQEDGVLIRNRIDGLLRNLHFLPKSLQAPLISQIKIMANMDIAEKRLPQDGRIKVSFSGNSDFETGLIGLSSLNKAWGKSNLKIIGQAATI